MVSWYADEGLNTLEREWRKKFPNAVVYSIGDINHSSNPDITQHAPDKGGSKPGDDKGEVDAKDFMKGKGVSATDLKELFEGLTKSRDKRLLIVIYENTIVSSILSPWEKRIYTGKKHDHVHVSVNDNYDNDKSDWHWEKLMARPIRYFPINGTLPELQFGDEDQAQPGWNHVGRSQVLANYLDNTLPDLDTDGVYGAKSVQKFAKIFGGNGKKLSLANIKKLHGIS
jgi:hypothetical protein